MRWWKHYRRTEGWRPVTTPATTGVPRQVGTLLRPTRRNRPILRTHPARPLGRRFHRDVRSAFVTFPPRLGTLLPSSLRYSVTSSRRHFPLSPPRPYYLHLKLHLRLHLELPAGLLLSRPTTTRRRPVTYLSTIPWRICCPLPAITLLLCSCSPSEYAGEPPPSPEEVYETFRQQIIDVQPEGENAWPQLAEVAEQLRAWTYEHRDAHFASIYDSEFLRIGDDHPLHEAIRRDTPIVFDKALAADLPAVILGLIGRPVLFPFDPEESMPGSEPGQRVRELSSFLHAVGYHRLHEEDDAEGWLETISAVLVLAEATEKHPGLLPFLIARANRMRAFEQIQLALTEGRLPQRVLVELSGLLETFKLVSTEFAIDSDRKLTHAMLARHFNENGRASAQLRDDLREGSFLVGGLGIGSRDTGCRGRIQIPGLSEVGSWLEKVMEQVEPLLHLPAIEIPEFEPFIDRPECNPLGDLVQNMGSAYRNAVISARRDQASHAGVRLAVALERYHAAHNAYPAALADLVPDSLDAIPGDPFTGQPFGYRATTDAENAPAGYVLYSFGGNGTDNGGRACEDRYFGWNIESDYECDVVLSQRSRP